MKQRSEKQEFKIKKEIEIAQLMWRKHSAEH